MVGHGQGRHLVGLAAADQPVVVELAEAQAGIGLQVAAVEPAQAVDADAAGAVLVHQVLHRHVHGAGLFDLLAAGLDDLLGRLDPAVGERLGRLGVGRGVGGGQLLEGDGHELHAHDLLGGLAERVAAPAAADDEDLRLPQLLQGLVEVGRGDRDRPCRSSRSRPACSCAAWPGRRRRFPRRSCLRFSRANWRAEATMS